MTSNKNISFDIWYIHFSSASCLCIIYYSDRIYFILVLNKTIWKLDIIAIHCYKIHTKERKSLTKKRFKTAIHILEDILHWRKKAITFVHYKLYHQYGYNCGRKRIQTINSSKMGKITILLCILLSNQG